MPLPLPSAELTLGYSRNICLLGPLLVERSQSLLAPLPPKQHGRGLLRLQQHRAAPPLVAQQLFPQAQPVLFCKMRLAAAGMRLSLTTMRRPILKCSAAAVAAAALLGCRPLPQPPEQVVWEERGRPLEQLARQVLKAAQLEGRAEAEAEAAERQRVLLDGRAAAELLAELALAMATTVF